MSVLTVGISEAKANLSKLIDQVNKTNETVTIFKNNAPVAEIRPAQAVQPIPFEQLPASTKEAILEGEKAVATGNYSDFKPVENVFSELGI